VNPPGLILYELYFGESLLELDEGTDVEDAEGLQTIEEAEGDGRTAPFHVDVHVGAFSREEASTRRADTQAMLFGTASAPPKAAPKDPKGSGDPASKRMSARASRGGETGPSSSREGVGLRPARAGGDGSSNTAGSPAGSAADVSVSSAVPAPGVRGPSAPHSECGPSPQRGGTRSTSPKPCERSKESKESSRRWLRVAGGIDRGLRRLEAKAGRLVAKNNSGFTNSGMSSGSFSGSSVSESVGRARDKALDGSRAAPQETTQRQHSRQHSPVGAMLPRTVSRDAGHTSSLGASSPVAGHAMRSWRFGKKFSSESLQTDSLCGSCSDDPLERELSHESARNFGVEHSWGSTSGPWDDPGANNPGTNPFDSGSSRQLQIELRGSRDQMDELIRRNFSQSPSSSFRETRGNTEFTQVNLRPDRSGGPGESPIVEENPRASRQGRASFGNSPLVEVYLVPKKLTRLERDFARLRRGTFGGGLESQESGVSVEYHDEDRALFDVDRLAFGADDVCANARRYSAPSVPASELLVLPAARASEQNGSAAPSGDCHSAAPGEDGAGTAGDRAKKPGGRLRGILRKISSSGERSPGGTAARKGAKGKSKGAPSSRDKSPSGAENSSDARLGGPQKSGGAAGDRATMRGPGTSPTSAAAGKMLQRFGLFSRSPRRAGRRGTGEPRRLTAAQKEAAEVVRLLQAMLRPDPRERISLEDVLKSAYILRDC